MRLRQMKGNILLFITTIIWGTTFVMQDIAMEHIGPFAFQTIRSIVGAVVLVPVILAVDLGKKKAGTYRKMDMAEWRYLLFSGMVCGFCLCVASCFQQVGIAMGTPAGKAGFITAMYIIFVPIIGLFMKKKVEPHIWVCVLLSTIGLYLLCVGKDDFSVALSDIVTLLCAVSFGFQILAVDYFAPRVDCIRLASLQFLFSGIFASVPMLIFEETTPMMVLDAWFPLVFAGVFSCGIAYTLQIIGQKYTEPAIGSLIMSFESFFATIASVILLPDDVLTPRELLGCGIMFVAILLSQITFKKKDKVVSA